jgi:predicted Zn-dependent protease
MQEFFYGIADHVTSLLHGDEVVTMSFDGEESEFIRFNHNAVRQPGSVVQSDLGIDLIRGATHAEAAVALSGVIGEDKQKAAAMVTELRARLEHVPEDPHLLYATEVNSTERIGKNELADVSAALSAILAAGAGKDLVGMYAQGPIYRGFANSLGQKNWFCTYSFNLDWCFYLRADKAVKTTLAGFKWDQDELNRKMQAAGRQLELLDQPAKTIDPGKYRVYLSPVAMSEVAGLLAWMGFGLKGHKSKVSCLIRMTEGDATLDGAVTVSENTKGGIAPNFNSKGFIKPDQITMIDNGVFKDSLVSARSAKEYDLPANGAEAHETPSSLDMAAGEIPAGEILERLDTGVYVNNLHYLNYSDRPACRMTGMTRFATLWVENGKIVAPLNVMRFDESLYRIWGSNLIGLTRDRDMILSSETYGGRSCESLHLPGALVEDFAFTL